MKFLTKYLLNINNMTKKKTTSSFGHFIDEMERLKAIQENKPLLVEVFEADGKHSHWNVVNTNGDLLWSEAAEDETPLKKWIGLFRTVSEENRKQAKRIEELEEMNFHLGMQNKMNLPADLRPAVSPMKTPEDVLKPYIETPFRHTEIVEKDNALKAMTEYLSLFKETRKWPTDEEMDVAHDKIDKERGTIGTMDYPDFMDGVNFLKQYILSSK